MRKIVKRVLYAVIGLIAAVCLFGLALAFWPVGWKIKNKGIAPEEAAELRRSYPGPHEVFTASDGDTLFLRRWNPDSIDPVKKDIAVLIFHGFTAYSGPYNMAGIPISKGGYTVFGLDYRGHGLSGGNRGDSPGKDQWIGDLANAVREVQRLGFPRVVVLGHSLGVAAAICTADSVPNDIAGLVLLSGAYEGRPGVSQPLSFLGMARLASCAIFRPSYRAAEYYRKGMNISEDTLFNFRYTPRFLTMLDVKKLRLPANLNIPVLVGVGDRDELFAVDKVRDFYALVPGDKKEFVVLKGATHAKISRENWEEVVRWLDSTYAPKIK
jgi:alpha-beta hydrolase superfamily lysophospholipase